MWWRGLGSHESCLLAFASFQMLTPQMQLAHPHFFVFLACSTIYSSSFTSLKNTEVVTNECPIAFSPLHAIM